MSAISEFLTGIQINVAAGSLPGTVNNVTFSVATGFIGEVAQVANAGSLL